MRDILLPKGIMNLKDNKGKRIDYDIPLPVFSPGSEEGILEQLVLSLYFRGSAEVIDQAYVVRQVEQPLVKFFINQICLWNIQAQKLDSWEKAASFVASEHVLVTPNILRKKAVELQKRYETLSTLMKKDHATSTPRDIQEIAELLDTTINYCTKYRDPNIISLLHRFQEDYKKPNNKDLSAVFDMYRRIVDKSLQGSINSSKTTIVKLIEQFEENPTLVNARLVDVFSRQHNSLGFGKDKNLLYNDVKDVYLKCIDSVFDIREKVSSYTSLIIFEKLLSLTDKAIEHARELEQLDIPDKYQRFNHLRNIFKSNNNINFTGVSLSKLGILGLEKYYHPDHRKIIHSKLQHYMDDDGKEEWIPYPIDQIESLIEHAKHTKLNDIYYKRDEENALFRCLVFNQNPYISLAQEKSRESLGNMYIIKQSINPHYFVFLDKILGQPEISDLLCSDVYQYLFAVPDLRQEAHSPGSAMIATLPTKPKLDRHRPNGQGPIEKEKYNELQKS